MNQCGKMFKRFKAIILCMALVVGLMGVAGSAYASSGKSDVGGFVTRLYKVCLDRAPDKAGYNDWVNRLKKGTATGVDAAAGFIFSQEFTAKNLCNDCYVDSLYMCFLGRKADAAGKADWVSKLAGGQTRGEVFNGFAGSKEFSNICAGYGIKTGSGDYSSYKVTASGKCKSCGKNSDPVSGYVERLYEVCMGRSADAKGLKGWTDALKAGMSGADVASGFVFSKEFEGKNLCNEHFVDYMYNAFFNRDADAAGKASWMAKLNGGATRGSVFAGFTGSQEFTKLCASYGILPGTGSSAINLDFNINGVCAQCKAEKAAAEKAAAEKAAAEKAAAEKVAAEKAAAEKAAAEKAAAEKAAAEAAAAEKAASQKAQSSSSGSTSSDRSAADKAAAKAAAEKAAAERAAAEKAAAEKKAAAEAAAKREAAAKAAEEKAAAEKAAADKAKAEAEAKVREEEAAAKAAAEAEARRKAEAEAQKKAEEETKVQSGSSQRETESTAPKESSKSEPEKRPSETKPAETKPAETKPAETKPAETKHEHVYQWTVTKAATCTQAGLETGICSCGKRETREIAKLGHLWENPQITPASCTEKQCTRSVCGRPNCSAVYVEYSGEPAGHKEEIVKIMPTCTQDGVKTTKCSVCGFVMDRETLPATGHHYVEKIISGETCRSNGDVDICTECNAYDEIYHQSKVGKGHHFDENGYCVTCGSYYGTFSANGAYSEPVNEKENPSNKDDDQVDGYCTLWHHRVVWAAALTSDEETNAGFDNASHRKVVTTIMYDHRKGSGDAGYNTISVKAPAPAEGYQFKEWRDVGNDVKITNTRSNQKSSYVNGSTLTIVWQDMDKTFEPVYEKTTLEASYAPDTVISETQAADTVSAEPETPAAEITDAEVPAESEVSEAPADADIVEISDEAVPQAQKMSRFCLPTFCGLGPKGLKSFSKWDTAALLK